MDQTSRVRESRLLTEVPHAWAAEPDDYRDRTNPALLTRLLIDAVPVLKFLSFSVISTEPGVCTCQLPLTVEGSNQHGVHQAAVLGIAADYAGGIALGTLCHGAPIIGVHPQTRKHDGASLWAVSLRLDYKLPSSGDVTLTARVAREDHEAIQRRYHGGRMVLKEVPITLEGDDGLFATAHVTYFIQQAASLRPKTPESRPGAIFTHKRKASARLIAALRDRESSARNPRFVDPFARGAAGVHGELLATRFLAHSPQLSEMVAQRTVAADGFIGSVAQARQLVLIGAGYDFRPYRLSDQLLSNTVFEVDLPEMLEHRAQVVARFGLTGVRTVPVPMNLELHDLGRELCSRGFDPQLPTAFIYEGTSMYLPDETNRRVLETIAQLMMSPDSRLWMDYVTASVVAGEEDATEVKHFMAGMSSIGEPFVWGIGNAADFFATVRLALVSDSASDVHPPSDDPVYDLYRFAVVGKTSND
jgi:methyltransferase (TIGR00027 family)